MPLDDLAPDQRAVVQLVLQQDRSYGDLAGLLGITEAAVRERAHRGLERIAPGDGVTDEQRADIADYLLGQQSVSAREGTRTTLTSSPAAAAWAAELAETLRPIARSPLPDLPTAGATPTAVFDTPVVDEEPVVRARPRRADPEPAPADTPVADEPVVRARPRPRAGATEPTVTTSRLRVDEPASAGGLAAAGDALGGERAPSSSRLGGALVIGALGILVAVLIVWLVTKGGDNDPGSGSASTGTTPDATAAPSGTATGDQVVPLATLKLDDATGGNALGAVELFAAQNAEGQQQYLFQLVGRRVPANAQGEAYGVWITGGDEPHFLGYAPTVADNGQLGVSGPQGADARNFIDWLVPKAKFIVTRETEENPTAPGTTVLSGKVSAFVEAQPQATATASP